MRIGIGYDVHPLVKNRKLFLGGIEIPHTKGLAGHSDGDVLIHAICDALLGAVAEDDIGTHFPDTDMTLKNIASGKILARIVVIVKNKGFRIANVDAVVAAEEPKIAPYRPAIRANLAAIMGISQEQVMVKGKTTEGLGFVGRKEGIEVYATALVEQIPS